MALTKIDDRGLKTPIDLLDNEKIRFGTGNDFEIYHSGTTNWIVAKSHNLHIDTAGGNENAIKIIQNGTVEIYYDSSKKFETTSSGVAITGILSSNQTSGQGISLGDNVRLDLGSGDDLQIWHQTNSDHGYIKNLTGSLYLQGNNSGTVVNHIALNNNGAVDLFYNSELKLQTTATGLQVKDTSAVHAWIGLESSDGTCGYLVGQSNAGSGSDKAVAFYNAAGNETLLRGITDGAVELYYNNSKKLNTSSTGVVFQGNANVSDSSGYGGSADHFFSAGNSSDLKIYHHGSWGSAYINNSGSGALFLESQDLRFRKSDGNELYFQAVANGAVSLYYDDSLRALTTANGFQVQQAAGVDVEFRIKNSTNTNASATNYILSEHDGRTTAKIVFGRNNDANDFSASASTTQGDIQFHVTHDGSSNQHGRFINTGYFHACNDGNFVSCDNSLHATRNTGANWAFRAVNSHASTPYGVHAYFNNSDPDTGNYPFFQGQDQTGTKFRVQSNGNVENHDNSYGSISDIKLKENIVDAESQWEDIKAIKVRNFNFKTNQSRKLLGVVAQELETVSPGLVVETPDEDLDHNDLGTTTKSVRYSILYMKAIKALQEAMAKIEILETEVAALKAK